MPRIASSTGIYFVRHVMSFFQEGSYDAWVIHPNQQFLSRRKVYRIILPVLVLGMLALVVHWQMDFATLRQRLESSGTMAPILFICVGIMLMSACVPKTVMSISAGALFGTWVGSGLMVVLAVTAAMLNYHIGRWWMHPSPKETEYDKAKTANQESFIGSLAEMAAEAGFASHLLIRLSPIPTMVISYAMGSFQARQKPYLAAAAVAVIPQILWVHSGTAATLAGDTSTTTAQWISIAIAVIGGILVAVIIPREAMRRIRESRTQTVIVKPIEATSL